MKLQIFNQVNFLQAVKALFKDLKVPMNYVADEPTSAKEILKDTYKDNDTFQLMDDVYFVGMVDDAAFEGNKSLASEKIKSDYDGILIFGVTLKTRSNGLLPTRSQLAEISRAFNREFYYTPVVVVIKYGNYLAFANTERLKYKQEWREGEKAGKVSLLRDIHIEKPHSGHERILAELQIPTTGTKKVDSFAKLYAYWQEVFSVSLLNKKFYQELSNWYFWATQHVTFPGEPTIADAHHKNAKLEDLLQEHRATNVIRMLTRLLFVWFIKEKKLIPEELFELDALQKDILNEISPYHERGMFKEHNKESIYYKTILQNLFFATLNCPIKPDGLDKRTRDFRRDKNYGDDFGNDWLYRYKKHFKNPEKFLTLMNSVVPFLNGGLFECLDEKHLKKYVDGFSDHMAKGEQLIVPDYLFFGVEEETDLSDIVGINDKKYKQAAVKGLINILKSYKFTITENTPIEEDVALDPELLGKVFENLLASYNPETKTTARKQTGSFYTPREIVNYMVDESLIAYLKNAITNWGGLDDETLDKELHVLTSFDSKVPFSKNPALQREIITALSTCTILDPACGSGAFPMGILQKMVHILQKLDPDNIVWREVQEAKAKKEAEEAFDIDDKEARNERLNEISEAFDQSINDPDYARKLFLIETCIYGVDIQPIATQISKLRFFISLVVEQKVNAEKDNFGIRPLPNLETKFVAANTLIGIEKPSAQLSLYDTQEVKALETKLKKVRSKLFSAKSKETKLKYREEDKVLRNQIAEELEKSGWKSDTAQKLAGWDPYDQNASSSFFDPEWMFDIQDGFDVVIGNPPYVSANNMSIHDRNHLNKDTSYKTLKGKWDIYIVFVERSLFILNKNGVFTFIIPFGFLNQPYAEAIRVIVLNEFQLLSIVDLHNEKIFENATVPACIPIIQNRKSEVYNVSIREYVENDFPEKYQIDVTKYKETSQHMFRTENLDSITTILDGIRFDTINLDQIFYTSTGAEIHGKEKRGDTGLTISGSSKFDVLSKTYVQGMKPYIEGSAIKKSKEGRYSFPIIDTWLDYSKPETMRSPKFVELFDSEKIIIRRSSGLLRIIAILDSRNIYTSEKCLLIIKRSDLPKAHSNYKNDSSISLKYLIGILNSKVIDFYYESVYGGFIDVYPNNLKKLPLKFRKESKPSLIQLVDLILFEKKKEISNFKIIKFDSIIDSLVFNLYFPDHMKERGIDVLEFVERDIAEVMQGREFEKLNDTEKEQVIEQLHAKWNHPDNEVVKRMGMFKERSPEILKPILES